MLQPALLGGVAMGVLSALPVINLANCCCAWILFGGGLAAYLMQQQRPAPITVGDGALVGLMAGAIGAVVWTIVAIPLNAALLPFQAGIIEQAMSSDMPPEAREFLEALKSGPVMGVAAVVGFFITLCVCSVFGMVGGLFGALFFRKNEPPPPPVPPPAPTFTPPTFTPPPPPLSPPPPPDGTGA
ncbi:MAG: hypothetical protein IT177_20205 [Acidobacteria bacterium]|nr:hypothetical protein [Acidobacteriota bacterium]